LQPEPNPILEVARPRQFDLTAIHGQLHWGLTCSLFRIGIVAGVDAAHWSAASRRFWDGSSFSLTGRVLGWLGLLGGWWLDAEAFDQLIGDVLAGLDALHAGAVKIDAESLGQAVRWLPFAFESNNGACAQRLSLSFLLAAVVTESFRGHGFLSILREDR
jgi:hypothetical protein